MEGGALAANAGRDNQAPLVVPKKITKKRSGKSYNRFNIFFMLERQLILRSRGGGINAIEEPIDTSHSPLTKLKKLVLPPLCKRYSQLTLTDNWFLELQACQQGKNHMKSHEYELLPFKELRQVAAKNYREIDEETEAFISEVIKQLGRHHDEVDAIEEETQGVDTESLRPSKKRKSFPFPVSVPNMTDNTMAVVGNGAKKKRQTLSNDEVATVQQLMGMKAHSQQTHGSTSHDLTGHAALYPQPLNSASAPPITSHDPAVHQSTFLQDPNRADSEEFARLRVQLKAELKTHLKRERNQAGHLSTPVVSAAQIMPTPSSAVHSSAALLLQDQNNADSEASRIRAELTHAMNAHYTRETTPTGYCSPRPVSAQPTPTRDYAAVHRSAILLQDQNHDGSDSRRLPVEFAHAMKAHLTTDMNHPAGNFSANLQEPSHEDSESHRLQHQLWLLQEQMNFKTRHHTRPGSEYPMYHSGHTQAYDSLQMMAASPSPDLRANLIARYYEEYNLMQADSISLLPAARVASVPAGAPDISASDIDSYLARLEKELLEEAITRDIAKK